MVSRHALIAAGGAAALGAAAVLLAAALPLGNVRLPDTPRPESHEPTPAGPRVRPDSLARALVERNPFRVARQPVATAYDPATVGQPEPPPVPRPALALVGVIDGRDPTAVIEGLPGTDGARVVRVGDVIGPLRVHGIAGGTVRIVGLDTVWVLRVRNPW